MAINLLHDWCGLPISVIDAILTDFTFDLNNFHSSMTNQPFVKIKNGSIAFLPRLITHNDYTRMTSGALNKSSKRKVYDRLINIIEKKNLDDLHNFFLNNDIVSLKEPSLKIKSEIITPDFILFDKKNKSLFIIDYKHFLIPLNANESLYKLTEIKKAIKQVSAYKSFIRRNPDLLRARYEHYVPDYTITPILICKWPIPVPISINEEVFVLSKNQIETLILEKSAPLKNGIENYYQNLFNDLKKTSHNLRITKATIQVGEWSYNRSLYVS